MKACKQMDKGWDSVAPLPLARRRGNKALADLYTKARVGLVLGGSFEFSVMIVVFFPIHSHGRPA